MKRYKYCIGALMIIALMISVSSCTDSDMERPISSVDEVELEFKVILPDYLPEVRALIKDDTQSDDWNELSPIDPRKKYPIKTSFEADDDALYLFENGIIGEKGIFQAQESGGNTTFKGRFKGKPVSNKVIALYPAGSYGGVSDRIVDETYFNMKGQKQVGNNTIDHLAPYLYMTGEADIFYTGAERTVQISPISLNHETVMYKFVIKLPAGVRFNNAMNYSNTENRVELSIRGNSQTYEQRRVAYRTHRTGSGDNLNRTTNHNAIYEGDKFRRQILDLRDIEAVSDDVYTFYMLGLPTWGYKDDILEVVLVMENVAYISRTRFPQNTYMQAGNVYTINRDFSGAPADLLGEGGTFVKASVFNNEVASTLTSRNISDYSTASAGNDIKDAIGLRGLIYALEKAGSNDENNKKTFTLQSSIHITADQWTPIGAANTATGDAGKSRNTFRGTFNGYNEDGKLLGIAVSGEMRNIDEKDIDRTPRLLNFGFFGSGKTVVLDGGADSFIRNLMVTADVITANSSNVGGIVGAFHTEYVPFATQNRNIQKSYFYGNIDARCNNAEQDGVLNIGGMLGKATAGTTATSAYLKNNIINMGYVIGRSPGKINFGSIAGSVGSSDISGNAGRFRQNFIDLHSSGGASAIPRDFVGEGSTNDISRNNSMEWFVP